MFGFRFVQGGPVVGWIACRPFQLTIRLRRQRITGIAEGGFIDLIIGERIIFGGLGRGLFRGRWDPEQSAQVVEGARFE